jgi:hypothetical protein
MGSIANAPEEDSRRAILLLQGASFVLGEHDINPTAVAGTGRRTVRFFNHHSTRRLYCVGVEQCTAGWTFPTTVLNVIAHESAHLFREELLPAVKQVASLVYDAMRDVKSSSNELFGIANGINEDYLSGVITGGIQKVAINEPLAEHGRFDVESVRLEMSNYLAGEVVAEAFGRYVICGEEPPAELSPRAITDGPPALCCFRACSATVRRRSGDYENARSDAAGRSAGQCCGRALYVPVVARHLSPFSRSPVSRRIDLRFALSKLDR